MFSDFVEDYSISDGLTTFQHLKDMAKHKNQTCWKIENNNLVPLNTSITRSQNFNLSTLPAPLIPFAFFEEVLCGGTFNEFLSENVLKNADKIKGYLGEFIGVMPPPLFRKPNEIGLIYKKDKNLYSVDYFSVTLKDNKIDNISHCE